MSLLHFEEHITNLREIYHLFTDIKNKKIKDAMLFKLNFELESTINSLDHIYYEATQMKNKSLITNILNERHQMIISTQSTLKEFMPYIIMYKILNNE